MYTSRKPAEWNVWLPLVRWTRLACVRSSPAEQLSRHDVHVCSMSVATAVEGRLEWWRDGWLGRCADECCCCCWVPPSLTLVRINTFSAVGFGHDNTPFLSTQQNDCNTKSINKKFVQRLLQRACGRRRWTTEKLCREKVKKDEIDMIKTATNIKMVSNVRILTNGTVRCWADSE